MRPSKSRKANTTKETLAKEIVTKGFEKNSLSYLAAAVFERDWEEAGGASNQRRLPDAQVDAVPEYSNNARSFIALFEQVHQQIRNRKADVCLSADDVRRLEKLMACHSSLDWTPVIRAFCLSEANYISRRDHSLPAFLDSYNFFLVKTKSHNANGGRSDLATALWQQMPRDF